ncbi:alpha-amylase [Pedobacter antarcticus 4BY]|uniref:Alpha-amylase n=3 Tax=Pedobacter antarcticus TaxID=34086 RepID=A0A081PH27_9SPHI|nr:alpha-amylase [Pedobacter antarcticus 4BY]SFF29481.1 Glycosidase [Pedobacter antarcticus]
MRRTCKFVIATLIIISGNLPLAMAQQKQKIMIYQLLPRLFGNKQQQQIPYGTITENGSGKFDDITVKALQGMKELGTTHVWYTGVIAHATLTDYGQFGLPADHASVVKGRAGSPYAVRDYYDVDPDLAVQVDKRMEEFQNLIERTHGQNLKVILDFVPNHVARQYKSRMKPAGVKDFGEGDDVSRAFSPENDYYYIPGQQFIVPQPHHGQVNPLASVSKGPYLENPAKATGNNVFSAAPSIDDWYETIKLNYGLDVQGGSVGHYSPVPAVWLKMKDILSYWSDKGADGFRCDMAEMVPIEFWAWVIPELKKKKPELIFIGEAYDPSTYKTFLTTGKFDYLYDKVGLYDGLKKLIRSEDQADVAAIRHVWQQESAGFGDQMLRFLENHDEERIASAGFAGKAELALPAMVLSATLSGGPVMLYSGQEVGEPGRGAEGFGGEDNRTTIFDYWGVPEHQKWMNNGAFDGGQLSPEQHELRAYYGKLLKFAGHSQAVASGEFLEMPAGGNMNQKMYGFFRFTDKERLLILVNFDRHYRMESQVRIPDEILKKYPLTKAVDQLSGEEIKVQDNHTLPVWLQPVSAQIISF